MIVDINTLSKYKANKLLRCQKHPTKDLLIWNYSDLVQMNKAWDDITTITRGLVTDSYGNIIARSFPKFYNIEEGKYNPTEDFVIYEKLDGSLILVFFYDGEWIVASRGSFTSHQALHARQLLNNYFEGTDYKLDKKLAYTFEIIYPENRIVVDYKGRDELVFLTAYDVHGNEYLDLGNDLQQFGIKLPTVYSQDDYKSLKSLNWENNEGFVVRFSNGDRVKIKFENYLNLHRIVTHMNGLRVWEIFAGNPNELTLNDCCPDEFLGWVKERWSTLHEKYNSILTEVTRRCEHLKEITSTRAEFAKLVKNEKHPKLFFHLVDGRMNDFHQAIVNLLRPQHGHLDIPFSGKSNQCCFESVRNTSVLRESIVYSNKKTFVFDVDGTLANNDKRSPYDWSKVGEDTVIDCVKDVLKSLYVSGYNIIICTGRDGICKESTMKWFEVNSIPYDYFYIRTQGNRDPDYIVKEEMWRDISKNMEIVAIFDDRNSVVEHGRKCGYHVFQVNNGDF